MLPPIARFSAQELDAMRTAHERCMPFRTFCHTFNLKSGEGHALIRYFRDQADEAKGIDTTIASITMRKRVIRDEGGGYVDRVITLPRISMHVAVLKERGHVEA